MDKTIDQILEISIYDFDIVNVFLINLKLNRLMEQVADQTIKR